VRNHNLHDHSIYYQKKKKKALVKPDYAGKYGHPRWLHRMDWKYASSAGNLAYRYSDLAVSSLAVAVSVISVHYSHTHGGMAMARCMQLQ